MRKFVVGFLGSILFAATVVAISSVGYGFEARNQLNINTATAEEFGELPGMDMELARSIVAYRKDNGPFSSIDDLLKVKGMDKEKLEPIRMYLTVGPQTQLE